MATCATCGTDGVSPGLACMRCGTSQPELELDLRARPAPNPSQHRLKTEEAPALELAVDLGQLVQQRSTSSAPSIRFRSALARVDDVDNDAHILADLGPAPSNVLRTPTYAWRVLKRRRELRAALAGRLAEAELAAVRVEDALVAFTERLRAPAEKLGDYAVALEDLERAEDVLRSRDKVLAAEQDAQTARQAQVDERLAKLEADLLAARDEERTAATELSAAQSALAHEEARLKQAGTELKAAQHGERRGAGGAGA